MKLPEHFWSYTKVILIAAAVIAAFVQGPDPIDSGDSPPPLWLAVIPLIFFALFLPLFLRTSEFTQKYVDHSPWPAYPFAFLNDPLPFWHFCGWGALASLIPQTYHALTPYDHDQMSVALVMLACGIGALLGVHGARKSVIRRRQFVEPSA